MEHDPDLTINLADLFRSAIHGYQYRDPHKIAAHVFADLLPPPWILAGSLDALPEKLHAELPPGTIEALCALMPSGDEALSVYRMYRAKRDKPE